MGRGKNFTLSNKAHSRCLEKARREKNIPGKYDEAFIKENYHFNVMHQQKKSKRVLTDEEKKKVYNDVICTFY